MTWIIAFVAGVVVGGAVGSIAQQYLVNPNLGLDQLRKEATFLVGAAERVIPRAEGMTDAQWNKAKLDYVMSMLDHSGLFKRLDARVLRAAVEFGVGIWKDKGLNALASLFSFDVGKMLDDIEVGMNPAPEHAVVTKE